jgi:predicted transglutaminase-like cysteine proteinase
MYDFLHEHVKGLHTDDPRFMPPLYKTAVWRVSYAFASAPRRRFLDQHPDQGPAPLTTADVPMGLLEEINVRVDNNISFRLDGAGQAAPESWDISPSQGDCDDRTLTKRYILNKHHGVPLGALNPVIGTQDVIVNGIRMLHLMLCVSTSEGDYIMNDQPKSEVVFWRDIQHLLRLLAG